MGARAAQNAHPARHRQFWPQQQPDLTGFAFAGSATCGSTFAFGCASVLPPQHPPCFCLSASCVCEVERSSIWTSYWLASSNRRSRTKNITGTGNLPIRPGDGSGGSIDWRRANIWFEGEDIADTPAKTTYSRRTGSARPVIHRSFHMGAIPGASVFEFCGQRSYPWHPDLPASNLGRSGNCTCGLLGSLCCWSRPGLGGNHTILGGLPSQSASNS